MTCSLFFSFSPPDVRGLVISYLQSDVSPSPPPLAPSGSRLQGRHYHSIILDGTGGGRSTGIDVAAMSRFHSGGTLDLSLVLTIGGGICGGGGGDG